MPIQGTCRRALAGLAVALMVAAAHGADDKAGRYYEDALIRFNQKDLEGAAVQLRNALLQDPSMTPARLLLGKTHLALGQPAAAEAAFRSALLQGAVRSEVLGPLAQSLLDQAKYRTVIDSVSADGLPPRARLEVLVLRAHAMMELGNLRLAAQELETAKAIDPSSESLLLAKAMLALTAGDLPGAASTAEQATAAAPKDARAWNMKASVAHAAGNADAALDGYTRALALDPGFTDARVGRASLLFDLRRFDEAGSDLLKLAKEAPGEPRAAYLRGLWLARKGDHAGSRDALAEAAKLIDTIPMETLSNRGQLLLLGGLSHYGLGNGEKAKSYLERYLALRPADPGPRKVLGALHLSSGAIDRAVSVLEPALKAAPNDGYLLSLLAGAYLAQKRFDQANTLLEKAAQQGPGAPELGASLGFSLLAAGQDDLALQHLERAYRDGGQPTRTGIALALLHMKQGRASEAVTIAETLAQRSPKDAVVLNLLGAARAAAHDVAGAEAAYRKAAAADPRFVPAQLNLVRLDRAAGRYDAARARLQAVLKQRPRDVQAMHELALVEEARQQVPEAIRWLEKARSLEPRNLPPILDLIDLYIRNGKADKALAVAKDMELVASENLTALAALGRAFDASGDRAKAQVTYRNMARRAAFDSAWQYRIAQLFLSVGGRDEARYSLEKAVSAKPDDLPSLALLVEIELQSGNLTQAEQRMRALEKQFPASATTYRLQGDLALARKNYHEATQAYGRALAAEQTTSNAIYLFRAHIQSGATARAVEFMQQWQRNHPNDAMALRALAEGQLRLRDYRAARASYDALLKKHGDDAAALNNLAVAMLALGDPSALTVAEKAQRLAPESASANDTLGWVLVNQGELDRGMRYLREAQVRDPGNGEVRYHLAVALSKSGRLQEARQELELAMRDGGDFEGKEQAGKLLQTMPPKR